MKGNDIHVSYRQYNGQDDNKILKKKEMNK